MIETSTADRTISSVIATIRMRTRDLHVQLESRFDARQAFASRETYVELLRRYLGVFRPLERSMDGLPGWMQERLSWPERRKMVLLERDLAQMGARSTAEDAPGMPCIADMDAALGVLYVVEGSCLGGQYLYRDLNARLGLDATSGASFLKGYGETTGSMWKAFLELLEREVRDAGSAADTACDLFRFFETSLEVKHDRER